MILKVGIIGCGRIANKHYEILNNDLKNLFEIVSICDLDENKANSLKKNDGVKVYKNYNEMISSENIDLIVILTESGNHAKHVIDVLKYKTPIVIEKPLSLKLKDAYNMVCESEKQKVPLFLVKQNRYNFPVKAAFEAFKMGKLGNINMGTVRVRWCRDQNYYDQDTWRGTWQYDGGVLTNQASHHIDLLLSFMGEVKSVFARSITAAVNIEAEDTAIVSLKFQNGSIGIIEATTAIRPKDTEGSLSLIGSKGFIEIGGFAVNKVLHWNVEDSDDDIKINEMNQNPPNIYGFGHNEFYKDVYNSLINNKPPVISGRDGIKTVELLNAIYTSIKEKREVFLPMDIDTINNYFYEYD